jgi:hypothetical protein
MVNFAKLVPLQLNLIVNFMVNDRIKYKQIKISDLTKKRLDILKGKETYDSFFDMVIGYFEVTGVNPRFNQLPPAATIVKAVKEECAAIYKRVEDTIKILRKIENTKLDAITHSIDAISIGKSVEENFFVTDEEVLQLVQRNEKLEGVIRDFERSNIELHREVLETIEELLSDKALSLNSERNLVMTRDYRSHLIQKIVTILHVQ